MTLRAASSLLEASTLTPLLSLPVHLTALSTPQWETTPAKRALLDTSARMLTQPISLTVSRDNTLTLASVLIAQRDNTVTQGQPSRTARTATTHHWVPKCVCNVQPAMTALTVTVSLYAETMSSWTLMALALHVKQVSSVTCKPAFNHTATMDTIMLMAQEQTALIFVTKEVTAKNLMRMYVMMAISRAQDSSTKLVATLE